MGSVTHQFLHSLRFVRFSVAEGLSWRRRHGRLPRWSECAGLLRKALFRFTIMARRATPAPKTLEPVLPPYEAWQLANVWNERRHQDLLTRLSAQSGRLPKLSIVMP